MVISVYQNGVRVGWVSSVSVYKNKFYITQDRSKAKKSYRSIDEAMGDVDLCCSLPGGMMYGFVIE